MTAGVLFAGTMSFILTLNNMARENVPRASLFDAPLHERAATTANLFGTAVTRETRGIEDFNESGDAAALAVFITISAEHPLPLHVTLTHLRPADSPLAQGVSAGFLINEDKATFHITSWLDASTP